MIVRSASGNAMRLRCETCGRTLGRRWEDVEALLTLAIHQGWSLVNSRGEPRAKCPYCMGIHGSKYVR